MASNAVPFALPAPPVALLAGASLFIDFDGTLVELVDRPDAVFADGDLLRLLADLARLMPGRVALVSGRSIAQLDEIIGELDPALAYAGSHGSERRWHDGALQQPRRAAGLDDAIADLRAFAALHPGVLVEPKSFSVALHYRLAPEMEEEVHLIARSLARRHGFVIQHGKKMIELKSVATNKGSAVLAFLRKPEMAGTRPIFIGDDLTDEAGFTAVRDMGGAGVLVGAIRQTAASYLLPDVTTTRAWLAAALEAL